VVKFIMFWFVNPSLNGLLPPPLSLPAIRPRKYRISSSPDYIRIELSNLAKRLAQHPDHIHLYNSRGCASTRLHGDGKKELVAVA
jgi:hypothetical protein